MGPAFWIRRFLLVFALAFTLIALSHLLRARGLDYALSQALIWGLISATVFTGTRLYRSRRGQHCALCKDTPEFHDTSGPAT